MLALLVYQGMCQCVLGLIILYITSLVFEVGRDLCVKLCRLVEWDLSRWAAMHMWTLALIIVFTFMTMNMAIGLVLQCVLLYGILKVLFEH